MHGKTGSPVAAGYRGPWLLAGVSAAVLPSFGISTSGQARAEGLVAHGVQARPFRWWIPLTAAVGAALLAGLVACAIFTVWRMRRRCNKRQLSLGQAPKLVSLHQAFQGSMGSPGSLSERADLETAAPVLTEQWRKRWMGAKEDEQIEIGPMIGRGGYGKVFKGDFMQGSLPATTEVSFQTMMESSIRSSRNCGALPHHVLPGLWLGQSQFFKGWAAFGRQLSTMCACAARWKSTMVAVKVVEHSHIPKSTTNSPNPGADKEDPPSAEARLAREMLLSTSISHPNVVQTYKICTIRVGSVLDSGFPGTNSAEVSPLAGMLMRHKEGEAGSYGRSADWRCLRDVVHALPLEHATKWVAMQPMASQLTPLQAIIVPQPMPPVLMRVWQRLMPGTQAAGCGIESVQGY